MREYALRKGQKLSKLARFYNRLMLEKEYKLDAQKVAEYFPVLNTIEKMLGIFETIFGLEFVKVTDEKELEGRIWHPDCKVFQVWNKGFEEDPNDGFVGWLYLDLHPREGKYGHAANFNLEPGFTAKDGSRHYPATALVCNFSKPTETKPSLLKHDEVVTLFHELGHGIHDLVSVTIYSRFHGTSVVRDFVEAPSQMLENWCWKPEQLKSLSSHYETGERLPDDLIQALVRTQHVNDALANLRQIHFGTFDLKVHNIPTHEEAENIDPTVEYNKLRTEIALLDPPEEDEGANKFGQGQATVSFPFRLAIDGFLTFAVWPHDGRIRLRILWLSLVASIFRRHVLQRLQGKPNGRAPWTEVQEVGSPEGRKPGRDGDFEGILGPGAKLGRFLEGAGFEVNCLP